MQNGISCLPFCRTRSEGIDVAARAFVAICTCAAAAAVGPREGVAVAASDHLFSGRSTCVWRRRKPSPLQSTKCSETDPTAWSDAVLAGDEQAASRKGYIHTETPKAVIPYRTGALYSTTGSTAASSSARLAMLVHPDRLLATITPHKGARACASLRALRVAQNACVLRQLRRRRWARSRRLRRRRRWHGHWRRRRRRHGRRR